MKRYVIIVVANYIPHVWGMILKSKEEALAKAKGYAGDWQYPTYSNVAEIYFNQEESGSMENAVSVEEVEVED